MEGPGQRGSIAMHGRTKYASGAGVLRAHTGIVNAATRDVRATFYR